MFGSLVLEVGIGLAMTFLLFSLILTSTQEGIESLLKGRAQDLEKWIADMIGAKPGDSMMQAIYEHPLIFPLYRKSYEAARSWKTWPGLDLPSYIPKDLFSAALADIVRSGEQQPSERVQAVVRMLDSGADGAANNLLTGVERWYEGTMERLSGQYKRKTQMWLFAIGLLAAAVANIDAIHIANQLATRQELRENIVAAAPLVQEQAKGVAAAQDEAGAASPQARQTLDDMTAKLVADGLPIGRPKLESGSLASLVFLFPNGWASLLGWVMTALAGMLGAPFWFDLLSKLMNVRSSIRPKGEQAGSTGVGAAGPAKPVWAIGQGAVEDGCCGDQATDTADTPDTDLPPAEGGVAPLAAS